MPGCCDSVWETLADSVWETLAVDIQNFKYPLQIVQENERTGLHDYYLISQTPPYAQ